MQDRRRFVSSPSRPEDVLEKLNAEIVRALVVPEVAETLSGAGVIIVGSTPQEFAARITTG